MSTLADLQRSAALPREDFRSLACAALSVNRAWLLTHADDPLPEPAAQRLADWLARRQQGEPVAYIIGEREFWGRAFQVAPGVLIPRPETELLVELALARLPPSAAVLDMGTGSGAIAVTLAAERPDAHVTALDISAEALAIARCNARQHAPTLTLLQSDWYAALDPALRFSLIVSNPPYIVAGDPHLSQGDLRFEPVSALTDHGDGLVHIRQLIVGAPSFLLAGGWLLFEHGYHQAADCRALLEEAGWRQVQSWRDLAGIERVTGACWMTEIR